MNLLTSLLIPLLPPPASPLRTTCLFFVSATLLLFSYMFVHFFRFHFQIPQVITYFLSCLSPFTSVRTPSGSIHVAKSHPFYGLVIFYIFFIHSSLSGSLGCCHVLAIVSNAAVNMRLQISFFELAFSFSSDKYPELGLLDRMGLFHF